MSSINFDQVVDRRNTASLKWDFTAERYGEQDLLPMWVADMDYSSPEEVVNALVSRAKHPVYGYTGVSAEVYDSIMNWMDHKHHWVIQKEWITFSAGVVSGFTAAILALSNPGDKVLIHTPVYTPFFDSIKSNDRELVQNPLRINNETMEIDFEDFEAQLQKGIKLFLLCSPHNPGGMVWSKEDLKKIGDLCIKYNVIILSDEIHADLCLPGSKHYPIASLSEEISNITVTFMAPSKTFNVAGIQASVIITSNKKMMSSIQTTQHKLGFHGLNLFALEVIKAAYLHGSSWLDQLVNYLNNHVKTVKEFIQKELPVVKVIIPEASYLIWLDCSALGLTDAELQKVLIQKGKIAISPGISYGPGGEGYIRLNIGCSTEVLMEGLNRLKRAFI